MKKTILYIIGIVVIVIIILSALKGSSDQTIKIGAVFPFTGSSGITGESSKDGLQLAVDEFNAQGGVNGKKVQVVYEDSQTKTDVGLSAYEKIRSIDKSNIVFTSVSGVALAVAPLANSSKVIQMDVVSATPAYSTPDDFTFRTGVNSYAFASKMSDLLTSDGIHKVAVLYVNTDFGVGYRDVFNRDYLNASGTIVTTESYNQGDKDFKTQLSKIKDSGAQALVLIALQAESPIILTQISQLKLSLPIYTDVYAAELQDNLKVAGLPKVVYIKPTVSDNAESTSFKQIYSAKYGKDPDFIAAQSYDGFRMVSEALKQCGGDSDTSCLKDALYGIKDFDGVIGDKISFDINGDIQNRALNVLTIKDGKFIKVE